MKKKPRFHFDNDSKGFSVYMSRKLGEKKRLQEEEKEDKEKQGEVEEESEKEGKEEEAWGSHYIEVFKFRYSLSSPIAPPYPLLVTSHVKNQNYMNTRY